MNKENINLSVSKLLRYPIKSVSGESLKEGTVLPEGFKHDRRWMIVDNNGKFLTQRKYHKMALIKAQIAENYLYLNIPNQPEKKIEIKNNNDWMEVTVWKDKVKSQVIDKNVNEQLSEYLEIPCHLVVMCDEEPRKINDPAGEGHVSFADAFPYLLVGTASLDKLNSKLVEPVSMENFRPNIVINTSKEHEEDDWYEIQIGEVRFRNVKLCSRCILITVNPETGERYELREPLKTLADYRKFETGEIMFGCNLLALNNGVIRNTDEVKVLSYIDKTK